LLGIFFRSDDGKRYFPLKCRAFSKLHSVTIQITIKFSAT
jgi:hypothetical protein